MITNEQKLAIETRDLAVKMERRSAEMKGDMRNLIDELRAASELLQRLQKRTGPRRQSVVVRLFNKWFMRKRT